MTVRYANLIVMLVWLGGCATVSPSPTAPANPSESAPTPTLAPASIRLAPPGDLPLAAAAADVGAHRGASVRWGGKILALQNEAGWTRLEIEQHPLDRNGQPRSESDSAGRFYARAAIPFDPQVYAPGRQITVAGTLAGPAAGSGTGPDPSLPLVEAKEFYLWGGAVAQSDEPLFRPHRRPHAHSFNLLDFLSSLPFSVGVGYWNSRNGHYPGYWGGWRGYYPGYWGPRSGLYFGIYR